MDPSAAVSRSVEAMNQVMKTATAEGTELAKKMVKAQHEMALNVPKDPNLGAVVDIQQ